MPALLASRSVVDDAVRAAVLGCRLCGAADLQQKLVAADLRRANT
jgi:hypothetical protein